MQKAIGFERVLKKRGTRKNMERSGRIAYILSRDTVDINHLHWITRLLLLLTSITNRSVVNGARPRIARGSSGIKLL